MISDFSAPDSSGHWVAPCAPYHGPSPTGILWITGRWEGLLPLRRHPILDEGTEFIEKPVRPDDLLVRVREVVGKTRA
jgi:hypothetical protein